MQHIESVKIFHGCFNKNKDGTNKLIEKGKGCICATSKPFWKYPWDVPDGVRTRSQEKQQKNVKVRDYDKYFQNIENIQLWLEASNSEMEILNETDDIYVIKDQISRDQ